MSGKKSTQTYKARLQEKVKALLEQIDELEAEEEKEYEERDLNEMGGEGKEIDSEKLNEVMEKINQRLKNDTDNKDLKAAKKQIEKDFLPRMKKNMKHMRISWENAIASVKQTQTPPSCE